MSLKYRFVIPVILLSLISCSRKQKFPEIKFERITSDIVELNQNMTSNEKNIPVIISSVSDTENEIDALLALKQFYVERDDRFDLESFESEWTGFNIYEHRFNSEQLMEWIETTGYLLELTGKAVYAEALEDLVYQSKFELNTEIQNLLKSFIYTKNVDHIQLNMFVNSTISYDHTLGGAVKITQDNDYPETGKLFITFNMEEPRYIELFIRIPSWASGATVTALSVKYIAPPGKFCQIARKWEDGDKVEIVLPVDKRPKY